jgi:undecaprenyl-diphosphatase
MIEWLESIDREIVLAVNGMHSPFLDQLMWLISGRLTWIPLYLYLFFIVLKKIGSKKAVIFLLFVLLSVAFSDLISVHLFKNIFLRYRPSHNLLIMDQLHFYQEAPGKFYMGGEYGFISSHAANIFAIITSVSLLFGEKKKKLKFILIAIGLIICLSRIYLGVHYFSDVLVGALVGSLVAFLLFQAGFKKIISFNSQE